jgi:hypothetical protein
MKVYYRHRKDVGNPIGDDWLALTSAVFDEYHISSEYAATLHGLPTSGPTRRPSSSHIRSGSNLHPNLYPANAVQMLEDELTPDAVQIVNAEDDATAFGVDALLVPDTAHDDPLVHIRPFQKPSDDETIPLDPRFVFHNTVEMLPPATGPPHQVVGIDCFDHACWPVCDPHSCHSFSDHGENSANLLSSLAIEDHSRELDYDGEILGRLLFLIADDDPVYDVSTAESFED